MFVLKSKYDRLQREYDQLLELACDINTRYENLQHEYREYRVYYKSNSTTHQFTDQELKSLLNLIHPDKHNGKQSATNMTQKVLRLLGKQ